jgi:glutamate racemase
MIGVFDSGFGGLTVLNSLVETLPQYDYLFLADSARAPYGARSLDVTYEFTLESVEWMFDEGCTHYPLLLPAIRLLVPEDVEILSQGEIVASRLANWLERHPEEEARLGRSGLRRFATTDDVAWFSARGERLLGRPLTAERIRLTACRTCHPSS